MNPYGMLCTGLLILINVLPSLLFLLNAKIAEKEARRASEYSTTLEFMCQQLQQLDILDALPDNIEHRDLLLNRAMDVRSAFMLYLAAHIQHGASSLGRLGMSENIYRCSDCRCCRENIFCRRPKSYECCGMLENCYRQL